MVSMWRFGNTRWGKGRWARLWMRPDAWTAVAVAGWEMGSRQLAAPGREFSRGFLRRAIDGLVAGMLVINLLVTWGITSQAVGAEGRIRTVLGTGRDARGPVGAATESNIGNPFGVEIGPDGGLYVTEVTNHRVWRVDRTQGTATIVAGTGEKGYSGDGGPAREARLNEPYELRFDAAGNLFFVEMQNHLLRRIDAKTGVITTVAGTGQEGFGGDGGPALSAKMSQPHSLALDGRGGVYIADIGNHRIRRVDLASGRIESIAGNDERKLPVAGEPARDRPVLGPRALFITGRTLWVALREGNSVWRLDLDEGRWQHVAGTGEKGYTGDGGTASRCTFQGPKGLAVDSRGDAWVVDTENQVVRRIVAASGIVETVAGSGPDHRGHAGDDGPVRNAMLNRPHGICVDAQGVVYIGDSENHRVREVFWP